MEILINHLPAAIKKGTSFQLISENRYFTGSDSYTLNITFPLKGCPQNQKIFGYIGRMDVEKEKIVFNCEIRDRDFYKSGSITITELTPEEVKTQFLEGRSEQNFADDFDDIYINTLDLGAPATLVPSAITPANAWKTIANGNSYVALPWVNNTSGNLQNACVATDDGNGQYDWAWASTLEGLSYQPYLIYIVKQMCTALGYTYDFSKWESSYFRFLLICNTLPYAWDMPEFAHALPKWTVTEFFEQLELLMNAEFDIDHKAKKISFDFAYDVIDSTESVQIEKVLDSYTTEISTSEDQCEYLDAADLEYAECDHRMWEFWDCPWLIKTYQSFTYITASRTGTTVHNERYIQDYNTFQELYNAWKPIKQYAPATLSRDHPNAPSLSKLLYAKDVDTYFVIYTTSKIYSDKWYFNTRLYSVNIFGKREIKEDNENSKTLNIVPCWIDEVGTSKSDVMFLECGTIEGEEEPEMTDATAGGRGVRYYVQSGPIRTLNKGEQDDDTEYLNKLFVAFWDGNTFNEDNEGYYPCPVNDIVTVRSNGVWHINTLYNLRLKSNLSTSLHKITHSIDTTKKYTFSFLSNTVPNVRAVFFIGGKRYVCEKITATFTEDGMSKLMKAVCYLITD